MINKSLGICIGASTVSAVFLKKQHNSISVESHTSLPHHGNPGDILNTIFSGNIPAKIAVTGKKFRNFLNLTSISEAEAVELAADFLNLSASLIISAGGENFIVYAPDKDNKIARVYTGNKCASGTGEFFLQQIRRMDLSAGEAVSLGVKGEPYNISGRCSVFCKSDCTHALNKGVPRENVVAGLSRMMARKITELLPDGKEQRVAVIGGVARNEAVLRFLRESFGSIIIPKEAPYFEALGSAIYALENETLKYSPHNLFSTGHSAFTFHRPLENFLSKVHFREMPQSKASAGDELILGLDVGSTTTKAVLIRKDDSAIVASDYLRTNGDPVAAARQCYRSLYNQVPEDVHITGLGVTGSGRHIAGLHALTDGVINEIIAHAAATVFFDSEADTIFEIGGQDAKYTYITGGVASDYAMNEACSAGTGSFLEEAALESLQVDYRDIGDIALKAKNPPNFSDQCSAFISSDIKNALQEGVSKEDILAGLVYSVCMNYNNRVRGSRPSGKKIFMQGGVCYNKAVPAAMAALTGKDIIVPPEPGLMGAFGVALEVKGRMELGLLPEGSYSLYELAERNVDYGKSFICAGGAERCDRKCDVAVIKIGGKSYPFGGACNKYYDLHPKKILNEQDLDLVRLREKLVFEKYLDDSPLPETAPIVGITKSFLTNTLYPLFYNFFTQLGFRVILAADPLIKGIEKKQSSFCYPVELAHGFFQDLLDRRPDYIFLPHITEMYTPDVNLPRKTCVLLQSENYYLKAAFKNDIKEMRLLSPVLDFSEGYISAKDSFIQMAKDIGRTSRGASAAYEKACESLNAMFDEFRRTGEKVIKQLESDPGSSAVVLFGRSYNAFASEANLGVPRKFSSRGIKIIPHDFLPSDELESFRHMYWAAGQQILRGARFVKDHRQLFGIYMTNFSCGPDSFIIPYFRSIMEKKPSLTLELDSHSADAGINTRIEAALDIIRSYRELEKYVPHGQESIKGFMPLEVIGETRLRDSGGKECSITDPSVKIIVPSMGKFETEAFSAAFRYMGINSSPLPVYDSATLTAGRGNTSCKECLPLILNTGSMIEYYEKEKPEGEKTLFFMAKGDGPCRLGQYHVYMEEVIKKRQMKDFGVYTLSDEDSYVGLGNKFMMRGWIALTLAGLMKDVFYAVRALAKDTEMAENIFNEEYKKITEKIASSPAKEIYRQLALSARRISQIEKRIPFEDAPKVVIAGEIFVRHDEFSRMDLLDKLTSAGFVVKVVPITEYIWYSNYLAERSSKTITLKDRLKLRIRNHIQAGIEKKIRGIIASTGFASYDMPEIEDVIQGAEKFISADLPGEAILTVGSALREIGDHVSGVISVGPFGCMPSRVAESVLNVEMNLHGKLCSQGIPAEGHPADNYDFPFLAVETDGNVFPQIIQSRIEIFMLQAQRMHLRLKASDSKLLRQSRDSFIGIMKGIIEKRMPGRQADTLPDYGGVPSEAE